MVEPDADGLVVIPQEQSAIPANAFAGCGQLTSIVLHGNVLDIGTSACKDARAYPLAVELRGVAFSIG